MKGLPTLVAVIGVAAIAMLVGYFGAGAVLRSLLAVGGIGFVAICAMHLVLTAGMGLAWRALLPGTPSGMVIWARLVRDCGSEALPLSQVGGYVLGARALALTGVPGTLAAASTIVDVTVEFIAQLAYTALGLAWFIELQPESRVALPVLLGLGVAALVATAFVLLQRRGIGLFDRIARHLGRGWAERGAAGAAAVHAALTDIYRRRGGLWVSFLLHFGAWIASAAEVWLALRLAGEALPFGAVLAIESLLYAIRTVAFLVPQAVGIQEAAYLLLGVGFGLTPEMSLALSLLKRGRDLAIGLPTIAIWQAIESSRLWRRRNTAAARLSELAPPPD
ncbi:MAG TPA: lysylphosphatidylglycerol synthase domain-containing protein [Stellaceae bacterium]|nr:lysylphosphatidylglycerol synthase domain-containing protein [Stellaceae bacterium]